MSLPSIQSYIFTTAATVMRAPLANTDGYGPKRDWAHSTNTNVQVLIYPLLDSEQSVDREYTSTHYGLVGYPDLDLLATDRVQFNPGSGIITTEVDGDPFIWQDPNGVGHHVEAKLKILRGA